MENFLTDYYNILIKLFEIIAALTGVFLYKKYKNTSVKYFIWILIGIALMELIGHYTVYVENFDFLHPIRDILKGTYFEDNNWFFTIFWQIGATTCFALYFIRLIESVVLKKIIKILGLLFLTITLVTIALNFQEFFTKSFTIIDISSSLLIILTVTVYLVQLLQSEKILSFYKSIDFYIAATLFIWHLITTPIIFYDIYFSRQDMSYVILKAAIMLFSIIFMYSTFTIALIFCKPQND